jgi:hypothetical protein
LFFGFGKGFPVKFCLFYISVWSSVQVISFSSAKRKRAKGGFRKNPLHRPKKDDLDSKTSYPMILSLFSDPKMLILFLLLFFPLTLASTIDSFTESLVWSYLNHLPLRNFSFECSRSLRNVIPVLASTSTLTQQRQFFYKSFASGDASQLVSLDMDRWFYRAIECLKVAGETSFSASEHPVHYCYATSEKAYGICLPSSCEKERGIVGSWMREER